MPKLAELYNCKSVRELGEAIGKAIGDEDDYASLVDLEFAQDKVGFADALHRFLRRFLTFVKKYSDWFCPSQERVAELMQLVDECAAEMPYHDQRRKEQEAIRLVRAALLSHALAQACIIKRQQIHERRAGGEQ